MSALDSWTRGSHTHDGTTHPTYRKGSGPGVVIIHEIPGMSPEVIGFADEVVAAGHTVVMPHLFGEPGAPASPAQVAKVLPGLCVNREFTKLATGETTPVAGWLRSLARELHGENFIAVEFEGRGHAVVTAHRQQEAVDRVLAFFGERLTAPAV